MFNLKFQALAAHNTDLLKEDLKLLQDDLDWETLVWSEGDVLDKICKVSVEIYHYHRKTASTIHLVFKASQSFEVLKKLLTCQAPKSWQLLHSHIACKLHYYIVFFSQMAEIPK